MRGDNTYKVGDYVRYLGDYSVVTGPLRAEGIGRIEAFEEVNGRKRINLFLNDRGSGIWCDPELINTIQTEEKHLFACGYIGDEVNGLKRYVRGMSVISGCNLAVISLELLVQTGFCIGDLTQPIVIDKYLHEPGKFDILLFYRDFPWIHNINDLFDYLKDRHIELNWEEIACL